MSQEPLIPAILTAFSFCPRKMTTWPFMEEVLQKKIPMVVICRKVDIDAPNVTTDEEQAMGKAMDYLLDNGHRNIGVIEGQPNLDLYPFKAQGMASVHEASWL